MAVLPTVGEAPGVASVIRSGGLWYFVAAIDGEVMDLCQDRCVGALRLRVTGMHVMTRRGGRAPGDRLIVQGLSGRSLLGGVSEGF